MTATEKRWTEYARQFVGKRIVSARYLTHEEADALGWNERPLVLVLDDGTQLYPSADDEGNGAGALFGQDSKGGEILCPVIL